MPVQTEPYDRLEEAFVEYELAREQGKALDRDKFLAQYPDLADELGPLFDAVPRVEQILCPLRESLGGKLPLALPALDGYEILEEIGHGAMGVVYKARQKGIEQLVALKLLRPDWLAGLDESIRREALEQFRNEGRAAARLQHPNRVRILHSGEHEGRSFYAMELIEGCSLADKLKRPGGVTKEKVVEYLASIAGAVQDAHDRGILHRDIKPGNILIDEPTDEAKLTDFGLAMIAPPVAGAAEQSVREQKRVVGTLPYMPPEQTQDADAVTVHSDVYSLGATLYEALTGVQPFTGNSRVELLDKIRKCEPERPHKHNRDINPQLERICLRCLCKVPEERFTARELAESLRDWEKRLHYIRIFTAAGTGTIVWGQILLLTNLVIYWMLQGSFWEPGVWLLIFFPSVVRNCADNLWRYRMDNLCRYRRGHGGPPGWREWSTLWGGCLAASAMIAVALRTGVAVPARDVILVMYPVFAALLGWGFFIEASKMAWKMSWGPIGFWLLFVIMLFHREAAPIYYGVYYALASLAYGLYLRKLGKQLG
jgi:serine/threonine protein kinase